MGPSGIRCSAGLLGPDASRSWSARPVRLADARRCTSRAGTPLRVGVASREKCRNHDGGLDRTVAAHVRTPSDMASVVALILLITNVGGAAAFLLNAGPPSPGQFAYLWLP